MPSEACIFESSYSWIYKNAAHGKLRFQHQLCEQFQPVPPKGITLLLNLNELSSALPPPPLFAGPCFTPIRRPHTWFISLSLQILIKSIELIAHFVRNFYRYSGGALLANLGPVFERSQWKIPRDELNHSIPEIIDGHSKYVIGQNFLKTIHPNGDSIYTAVCRSNENEIRSIFDFDSTIFFLE